MTAYSDFKTPQDVGSPCDGVNDDLPYFNQILATGNLYIPYGSYVLSGPVIVPGNRTVVGSKLRPGIKLLADNSSLFDIHGSDVSIENIWANFSHLPSGGGLVRFRNDVIGIERVELSRMFAYGANSLVQDIPGGNPLVSITCKEIVGRMHRGRGFSFSKSFAYHRMIDNLVDYVGSNSHNHIAYYMEGNQGAWWERCDTTGGQVDATTGGNHGFYFKDCVANWISNCMADTCGGGGLFLNGGNDHFYVSKFISSLCGTHPFSIVNNNRITFSGCEAGGRAGMAYAPSYPGFVLINTPNVIVDDACRAYNNVGGPSVVVNCPNGRVNPLAS